MSAEFPRLVAGMSCPAFSLKDQEGKERTEKSSEKLVLYFYPKDFTPGCTVQIGDFSKEYAKFKAKGYEIFGVSPDSVDSHKKFCDAHKAPYPLLSDPDCATAKAFGAYGNKGVFGQGVIRSTFVIEDGLVRQAHYKVNPLAHADALLKSLL